MIDLPPSLRLFVALDVPTRDRALALADRLAGAAGERPWAVKIGLELFGALGPDIVAELTDRGAAVFLDLKLHDIPATVARAVRSLGALGVRYMTVHASGGPAMLRAAAEAAAGCDPAPGILAVTVLTSLDAADLAAVGIREAPRPLVLRRAALAAECGAAGVIASPLEAQPVRAQSAPEFAIVTPGVRPAGAAVGDQKRVATPQAAIAGGASHLVVGRPIRDADDPGAAWAAIVDEIAAALSGATEPRQA